MAPQRSKPLTERQPGPSRLLRRLPSVDRVLEDPAVQAFAAEHRYPRGFVRRVVNRYLDGLRAAIRRGELGEAELEEALGNPRQGVARAAAALTGYRLRRVINATGVIVHTNLGRSPWSAAAAERVADLSRRYLNLEYDLEEGERGHRDLAVERLMAELFPGTAAAVVNNNAAAVLLVLNTLAEGREVVVSRGQLVEIGGSFRIPEIMVKSGAVLREVGTTNRTRLLDYERAIGPSTALLLAVHPSNYRVVGFTASVPLGELVELGHARGVRVVEDMGSGNLLDLSPYGIEDEPSVGGRLATGVDLVTFSGDKLLGGPQAGFIVGRPDVVRLLRGNPLYRAVRVDKVTYLGIEATLMAYVTGRHEELPTLAMLALPAAELRGRATALAGRLGRVLRGRASAVALEVHSRIGGGAAPGAEVPSWGVAVEAPEGPDWLAARLRAGEPAVVGRIVADRWVADLRTVGTDEEDELVAALAAAVGAAGS